MAFGGSASGAEMGDKLEDTTRKPRDPFVIKTDASIPDGSVRTFNGGGGSNAYSDGQTKIKSSVIGGGDSETRPKSFVGHWIIKHDY